MKIIFKNYTKLILITSFSILVISLGSYIIWFWLINGYPISKNPDDWAKLGDYFGGVTNSLFSFITLMTVVITLYYQKRELILTRKELKASRKVASLQEKALSSQAKSQNKTVFESGFMQMIEIHFKLIESYQTGNVVGSQNFNNCLSRNVTELENNPSTDPLAYLDRRMYRHLFHLAGIIDLINSNLDKQENEQKRYIRILYNVLSDDLRNYIRVTLSHEYYRDIRTQLVMISNSA